MSPIEVAVVGDRFMRPQAFVDALSRLDGAEFAFRTMELPWPDEPMEHGYAKAGLAGLKEYQGDPDAIADFVGDARILVDHLAPVTGPMLERLPRLELIAVSRGGPVNLDMAACRARGVKVVNTPGRNAPAVAEFTIGAILAETRLIREGHESLRQGRWRGDLYRADLTGDELADLTVGVIGYGHIGTRVVRYLKVFGPRILVHDPYVPLRPEDAADGVEAVGLDELLRRSDVVTLHPRVTPETTRMINADTLARMKPGRVPRQHRARAPRRLRRALRRAQGRPPARRHARDLRRRAAAARLAAPAPSQRDPHAPHRRRVPAHDPARGRHGGGRGGPPPEGRAAAERVLSLTPIREPEA